MSYRFARSRRLIVITDLPKHSAATSGVAQLSASRIASRSSGPTQLRRKVHLRANVIGTGAINDRGATVVVSVFEVAVAAGFVLVGELFKPVGDRLRSEEHTSELQSLMRRSYAVFCLKKKTEQKIV